MSGWRLPVGLVLLSDRDTDAPPLSAVCTVSKDDPDHGGFQIGADEAFHLGADWVDRPYWTGNPEARWLAGKVRRNYAAGGQTQLGNEQNHPDEGFIGGPAAMFALHDATIALLTIQEAASAIASPPSPGFEHWQQWVNRGAHAHAIHCYGQRQLMEATVQWFLDNTTADLYITECNPGAGNAFDLDAWTRDHLKPFLEWCEQQPRIKLAAYFAWRWDRSLGLPSSVDAAGSAVERALREWVARPIKPEVRPVAQIKGIDISNNNGAVDLAQVKGAGYEFVICKAAEDPTFVDQWLPSFWRQATEQEMVRGAYHFARPSSSSPAASVVHFQRAIVAAGGFKPGDVYALDIEDEHYDGSLHVWVAEWLDLAERVFGFPGLKYSGAWYTSTRDLEHPDLERWPTWWASYQSSEPAPTTGWSPIKVWQNSASAAVPGVQGNCDTNQFNGTVAELRALGKPGAVEPLPEPLPDPWATVDDDLARLTASIGALKQTVGR